MIEATISLLFLAYMVCQIVINRELRKVAEKHMEDIERLKNWRQVQDCKQQITDTALDMLFVSVHGDVVSEVRH